MDKDKTIDMAKDLTAAAIRAGLVPVDRAQSPGHLAEYVADMFAEMYKGIKSDHRID